MPRRSAQRHPLILGDELLQQPQCLRPHAVQLAQLGGRHVRELAELGVPGGGQRPVAGGADAPGSPGSGDAMGAGSDPASASARAPARGGRRPRGGWSSAGVFVLVPAVVGVPCGPGDLIGRRVRPVDRPLLAVDRLLAGDRQLPGDRAGRLLRLQGAHTTDQSTTPRTPTRIRMSPIVWMATPWVDTVEIPNRRIAPTAMSKRPAPILISSPL